MDTVWRWLGYSMTSSSQSSNSTDKTKAPDIEHTTLTTDKSKLNTTDNQTTETVIQNKMKPVLSETSYKTHFERFDSWTRERLPLEPEDNLREKLEITGMFTAYFSFMYYLMSHPHITNQITSKGLYTNSLRLFLSVGYVSFLHAEWYVPLYVKFDKEGNRLPRNYLEKLKADFSKLTGSGKTD